MKRTWPWLLVALGVLLFVGANRQVRGFCAEILYPFQRAMAAVGQQVSGRLGAAWRGLCDGPVRETQAAEIERLRVMLAQAERLAEENGALRASLAWQRAQPAKVVAAPVWAHGGGLGVWPRLSLAVGSAQGVKAGDAVVVPEGLVGRVAAGVTRHRCEVILLSDPLCRVAVELPGGIKGVVQGSEGLDFGRDSMEEALYVARPLVMRFVGKHAAVREGQEVFTEGSGGLFPAGLLIGRVVTVQREETGLLNEVLVAPAVDPILLRTAFVMVTPPQRLENEDDGNE